MTGVVGFVSSARRSAAEKKARPSNAAGACRGRDGEAFRSEASVWHAVASVNRNRKSGRVFMFIPETTQG